MSLITPITGFLRSRFVVKKVPPKSQSHGQGAIVNRSIGSDELKSLDPFLLLDEFSVSPPAGFPDHGHRGFETITYITEGGMSHQDFAGNEGTIHAGDVQCMTAGKGIMHSEMPVGNTKGLQLWINLPSKYKMMDPRYEEVMSDKMPSITKDGVEVKVIAGESMGAHFPVFTQAPMMFLVVTLKPNSEHHQEIPQSWNAFVYVLEGEGQFGTDEQPAAAHHLLVLGRDGEGVSVWNKSSEAELVFILVAGQPLEEPVVHQRPFVMNTQAEVDQAVEDYKHAQNGFERGKNWKSNWSTLENKLVSGE